jgi:hypothetical protein
MARYLLVLVETDRCDELVEAAHELAERDGEAEFVLMTPATPVPALEGFLDAGCTPVGLARERARRARAALTRAGLAPAAVRLGHHDPIQALAYALEYGSFAGVLVVTLPHHLMHWLHRDLACRIAAMFPSVPVTHVIAGERRRSRRPAAV